MRVCKHDATTFLIRIKQANNKDQASQQKEKSEVCNLISNHIFNSILFLFISSICLAWTSTSALIYYFSFHAVIWILLV